MAQEMKKFRLPRKLKKKLNKDFYLYPIDDKDSYLVAWPSENKEDYIAYKTGVLRGLKEETKKN